MDMLRSCYEVDMQFDQDAQIIRRVRWYFVPEDTPSFPAPQKFGSQNWQWRGFEPLGIGERWDSDRPWRDGSIPWPIKPPRLCEHVPVEWFDEGCPSNAPPLQLTPLGQATCCAPASGIYVSVKLRATLNPPRKGGLILKGVVRLKRIYHLQGGVLPGATLVVYPPTKVYGGILVGATVKPKLIYHASGGVLLSALVKKKTLLRGRGGPALNASKELMLIKVLRGGFRSGGKSDMRIERKFKGGLKAGGTVYIPPLSCQPWSGTAYQHGTCTNMTTGQNWALWGGSPTGCTFTSPFGYLSPRIIFERDGTTPCGILYGSKTRLYSDTPPFVDSMLTLQSYDAVTRIGTWLVSLASPVIPGQIFHIFTPP